MDIGQVTKLVKNVSSFIWFLLQGYEVESYFPMHRGCNIRLYQVRAAPNQGTLFDLFALQDTCVPADLPWLNMVQGPKGVAPTHHSCWKDLYYDLEAAEHIITITGWSVWTELR